MVATLNDMISQWIAERQAALQGQIPSEVVPSTGPAPQQSQSASFTGWGMPGMTAVGGGGGGHGPAGSGDQRIKQAPWWDTGLTWVEPRQRFGAPSNISINMQQQQQQQAPSWPQPPPPPAQEQPPPAQDHPPPVHDDPPPVPRDDPPPVPRFPPITHIPPIDRGQSPGGNNAPTPNIGMPGQPGPLQPGQPGQPGAGMPGRPATPSNVPPGGRNPSLPNLRNNLIPFNQWPAGMPNAPAPGGAGLAPGTLNPGVTPSNPSGKPFDPPNLNPNKPPAGMTPGGKSPLYGWAPGKPIQLFSPNELDDPYAIGPQIVPQLDNTWPRYVDSFPSGPEQQNVAFANSGYLTVDHGPPAPENPPGQLVTNHNTGNYVNPATGNDLTYDNATGDYVDTVTGQHIKWDGKGGYVDSATGQPLKQWATTNGSATVGRVPLPDAGQQPAGGPWASREASHRPDLRGAPLDFSTGSLQKDTGTGRIIRRDPATGALTDDETGRPVVWDPIQSVYVDAQTGRPVNDAPVASAYALTAEWPQPQWAPAPRQQPGVPEPTLAPFQREAPTRANVMPQQQGPTPAQVAPQQQQPQQYPSQPGGQGQVAGERTSFGGAPQLTAGAVYGEGAGMGAGAGGGSNPAQQRPSIFNFYSSFGGPSSAPAPSQPAPIAPSMPAAFATPTAAAAPPAPTQTTTQTQAPTGVTPTAPKPATTTAAPKPAAAPQPVPKPTPKPVPKPATTPSWQWPTYTPSSYLSSYKPPSYSGSSYPSASYKAPSYSPAPSYSAPKPSTSYSTSTKAPTSYAPVYKAPAPAPKPAPKVVSSSTLSKVAAPKTVSTKAVSSITRAPLNYGNLLI